MACAAVTQTLLRPRPILFLLPPASSATAPTPQNDKTSRSTLPQPRHSPPFTPPPSLTDPSPSSLPPTDMKVLSEPSTPAAGFPPSPSSASQISGDDMLDPDPDPAAPPGHADAAHEASHEIYSELLDFSSDQNAEAEMLDSSDDDDDDLQWANARPPPRPAPRSPGYGGNRRARNVLGKEKVRILHRPVPSPRPAAHKHRSALRHHSTPFSGPLTAPTVEISSRKPNKVSTIIPANFRRSKGLGLNAGEPMSPEVTCLGRIKSQKLDSMRTPKLIRADSRMGQKVRCFETKHHLCGKACRCRKKTRKRYASAEPKNGNVEASQTRREKAATLARSLTDMLEDLRRSQGASYEPRVPPPNSLLLMRGLRRGDSSVDTDSSSDEDPIEDRMDIGQLCEPGGAPPNSLLLMRGCRVRGNFFLPEDLSKDGASTESEQEELFAEPFPASVKRHQSGASRHHSLLDLIEREDDDSDESDLYYSSVSCAGQDNQVAEEFSEQNAAQLSQTRPRLYQRRAFGELSSITVDWGPTIDDS